MGNLLNPELERRLWLRRMGAWPWSLCLAGLWVLAGARAVGSAEPPRADPVVSGPSAGAAVPGLALGTESIPVPAGPMPSAAGPAMQPAAFADDVWEVSDDKLALVPGAAAAAPSPFPTVRVSGFFHLDAGLFDQDVTSLSTLGDIEDGAGFRRARLQAVGQLAETSGYSIEFAWIHAFLDNQQFGDSDTGIAATRVQAEF
jgi:hypothetical protein